MTLLAFSKHLIFAFGLFLFSSIFCWKIIQHSKIMDTPNHRSSHNKPTPTAGGLAIVTTFFLGMVIIFFLADKTMVAQKFFLGFIFSSILISAMSFYDDYKQKSFFLRFITQIIAILVVISFGIVITDINLSISGDTTLGFAGYLITFVWILGLTNAYNFMDGLNGMAGGNAVITSFFLGFVAFGQGSHFTYIVCYTICAGTLGFLVFNFPKGKLFMGDVGSTFLGFTFATLAIMASLYDNSHTSLLVIPLLLFHFIYDTFFTFLRRLIAKENVFQAHRTHLYQLLNRMGYSHTKVTLFYCAMCLAQGFGVLWMMSIPDVKRLLIFIPYLIFQIIYSIIIIYFAKKNHLM